MLHIYIVLLLIIDEYQCALLRINPNLAISLDEFLQLVNQFWKV